MHTETGAPFTWAAQTRAPFRGMRNLYHKSWLWFTLSLLKLRSEKTLRPFPWLPGDGSRLHTEIRSDLILSFIAIKSPLPPQKKTQTICILKYLEVYFPYVDNTVIHLRSRKMFIFPLHHLFFFHFWHNLTQGLRFLIGFWFLCICKWCMSISVLWNLWRSEDTC